MLNFKIEESSCTKCGLCAKDCPMRIIELNEWPEITTEKEAYCLKCQHCMAVCPTGSLSIEDKNPAKSPSAKFEKPNATAMAQMIKARRSTRHFKKEQLDKDTINHLLETASYAPTGHNDNGVHFSVVYDQQSMDRIKAMVYSSIKTAGEKARLQAPMDFLYSLQQLWEKEGSDRLFWEAPHLVIASAPNNNVTPYEDSIIALSYLELLANTNGIGTLWNGMIKWVINDLNPEIRQKIGIPENHTIGYVMLMGKPAVKYTRMIQSDGIHIKPIELN
jgi:nitroreductase/NAD-dependent dihydropyrimidine dehydrogenase PreA subunit